MVWLAFGSLSIEQIIRTGSIKDVDVLRLRSALHGDGIATFRAEQGDLIGRPGRLTVEVQGAGDVVTRVRVGGRAVTLLSGTLRFGPGP